MKFFSGVLLLVFASLPAVSQFSLPPNAVDSFRDTSMLKPPAGAKVAIVEFEDLECPLCAYDFSIVRAAVEQRRVALVRHDFPLTEIHPWSLTAAVTARYLQDSAASGMAETYRRDVFANQRNIASKDDLSTFTQRWFQTHGQKMPFVMDASGVCTKEVLADRALGERLHVPHTPCIFVVTAKSWTEVNDIKLLNRAVDLAVAETSGPVKAHR
ncbi:DsbA family protein [Granulicella arctica]|uniref:DsbA family protein n=1 Tax=Granulicella arctica TaxID=940613 RepID=UPI0021DF5B2A|nr:DsbA family protein [Granulicella arctica]